MKIELCVILFLLCTALSPAAIHPAMADFNHDGKVDLADLVEFASVWLWESSCDTAVTAVREIHYTGTTETSYWYVFTADFGSPGESVAYAFSIQNYRLRVYDDCGGIVLGTAYGTSTTLTLVTGDSYYLEIENASGTPEAYDLYIDYAGEGE